MTLRYDYWIIGGSLREMRNAAFKHGYLKACRKYCPNLQETNLLPCEAGIRAQAVLSDGTLAQDFLFEQTARMLHVCNAPSPAAPSALPIAGMIVERLLQGIHVDAVGANVQRGRA